MNKSDLPAAYASYIVAIYVILRAFGYNVDHVPDELKKHLPKTK